MGCRSKAGAGGGEGAGGLMDRRCLACSKILDSQTCVGDTTGGCQTQDTMPRDGDLTLCLYCGYPMAFTNDGLREMTKEEADSFWDSEAGELSRRIHINYRRL